MKVSSLLKTIPVVCLMVSCISDEPLGIECDIERIEVKLDNPLSIFNSESQCVKTLLPTENNITFEAKSGAKVGSYATYLQLSPGAKAFMQNAKGDEEIPFTNGDVIDYADEVTHKFVVRSQDNSWNRIYPVSFVIKKDEVHKEPFTLLYEFNEDSYRLFGKNPNNNNYYLWEENHDSLRIVFRQGDFQWKNGNPGFKIANSSLSPMDYPTVPLKGGGPDGTDCLKLETKYAGKMGEDVGCPNASGSLFNGKFDAQKALASKEEAVKSTLFGCPFAHVPIQLEADLKLVSVGTAYDDNGNAFTDEPDIYCVIYDNEGQTFTLDGGNVLTSDRIKGIARLPHLYNGIYDKLTVNPIHGLVPGGDWQHVVLPVDYAPFDKSSIDNSEATREAQIDVEKLNNYGYSMVIGASSSWQGGNFNAYIGQCLLIDNIKLTCVDPDGAKGEDPDPKPTKDNTCELSKITLGNASELFDNAASAVQNVGTAMEYTFKVKYNADLSAVPVTFNYNEKATMYLDGEVFVNGSAVNFTSGQRTFELCSEDESVKKQYILKFERLPKPATLLSMHFDGNAALDATGKFYEWKETNSELTDDLFATRKVWGTSNHGYSVFRSGQASDAYPVIPIAGQSGKGVKLSTLNNSTMGAMVGNRFTPGLLFLGYETNESNPSSIKASNYKMGVPFKAKPVKLTAYLKYTPGSKYQGADGNEVSGMSDEPDFFCVVYKNSDGTVLDASNVFTHKNIVGVGRLGHPIHGVGSSWTKVSFDINYKTSLTAADFASGQYSIVICAASSYNFVSKCGAIGSELSVDEFVLEYEK